MDKPMRRYHTIIDVQADDLPSLRRAVERIAQHFAQDAPSVSLVSGGYDSGYWLTFTEYPEQTHDKYVEENAAYVAQLNQKDGDA